MVMQNNYDGPKSTSLVSTEDPVLCVHRLPLPDKGDEFCLQESLALPENFLCPDHRSTLSTFDATTSSVVLSQPFASV